jgi:hypothetical protein
MSFAKLLLVVITPVLGAILIDVDSPRAYTILLLSDQIRLIVDGTTESIRKAAAAAARGLQHIYNGNTTGVLGKFPYPPYYWWESGAAWGGMVNYWHYTGDASYSDVTYNRNHSGPP